LASTIASRLIDSALSSASFKIFFAASSAEVIFASAIYLRTKYPMKKATNPTTVVYMNVLIPVHLLSVKMMPKT